MKRLLVVIIICMVFTHLLAQKVDLDKFVFNKSYRELPLNPLFPEVRSYSLSVKAPNDLRALFGSASLEDMIYIEGLKKFPDGEAQMQIELNLTNLVVNKWKVEERIEVLTDNTGKETGRKSHYRVDVNYTCPGSVKIMNSEGQEITTKPIGGATIWSSQEFATSKEATEYYSNNEAKIRMDLAVKQNKANLKAVNDWLSSNYGFRLQKDVDYLWILNSKKHPDHIEQQEAGLKFKTAVEKITADNIPDEVKATLQELVIYFNNVEKKYVAEEKADKKMRYSAYFNKAKIYLSLEDPESAIKEADALIANGYDVGDGKLLKTAAEALAESLKKNNTKTRHFVLDYSKIVIPSPVVIASWKDKDQANRVKKITESLYSSTDTQKPYTVNEKEFIYNPEGALMSIKLVTNGKPEKGSKFFYSSEGVVIKREGLQDVLKSYTFKNEELVQYGSNKLNTYVFERNDNKISSILHTDKCEGIYNVYQFLYDSKGRLDKLSASRKELGPQILEYYQLVYDEKGRVQVVNRTKSDGKTISTSFQLERVDEQVRKIHFSLGDKPWERTEFIYDSFGNVTEQRFFTMYQGKENLASVLKIEYDEKKGNDFILWDTNNWIYNYLMGIRTYTDLENRCH